MARTGCARTSASTGRYVPNTSNRAGPGGAPRTPATRWCRITPMQVLQHQDTGPGHGEDFHGLGEFPQHALPRTPTRVPLQRLVLGWGQECGQLEYQLGACWRNTPPAGGRPGPAPSAPAPPGGANTLHPRRTAQCTGHARSTGAPGQPTERQRYPPVWFCQCPPARNESHTALPLQSVGKPLAQGGELGFPRHQTRPGRRGGHGSRGKDGGRGGAGRGAVGAAGTAVRGTFRHSHRRDKAIAPAMHCGSPLRRFRGLPQRLAQFVHTGLQHPSPTAVSGQTASKRASLVTNWPACVTR